MKRIALLLILAGLTQTGCTHLLFCREEKKPPQVQLQEPPPPPLVTGEGITEKNASDRAKALRAELEYDMERKER